MSLAIIIPCYNQAQYLSDAIDSAVNQSLKPDEIIVINDGSTDRSLEIANTFASKYPLVRVINQVNKGLASARNTGLMNASSEWILPLDADDILKEDAVLKITEAMKSEADIVAPSFKRFGIVSDEIILDPNVSFKHFAQANYIGYFSAYKKKIATDIGGYSPRMTWGYEDYHFWIDLLKRGAKLLVLKDVLVMYRTKDVSMITTAQRHHGELMDQIKFDHPELYVP